MSQAIPQTSPEYDGTRILEGFYWQEKDAGRRDSDSGELAEEERPRLEEH